MLKNKEERRQFLLDECHWCVVYEMPDLHIQIKMIELPDGTLLIKEVVRERDDYGRTYMNSMQIFTDQIYRIVHDDYVSTKLSLTFLIEYLGKV